MVFLLRKVESFFKSIFGQGYLHYISASLRSARQRKSCKEKVLDQTGMGRSSLSSYESEFWDWKDLRAHPDYSFI